MLSVVPEVYVTSKFPPRKPNAPTLSTLLLAKTLTMHCVDWKGTHAFVSGWNWSYPKIVLKAAPCGAVIDTLLKGAGLPNGTSPKSTFCGDTVADAWTACSIAPT